ncbi:pre-mRNA-splicing factor CWC22 homolog isoform X2 [Polyodon spathula]|uniref:pre-mRNA-splicing factor CWC22 homolog isoform X2 n=1 Tax=Polyodon spathula TaxID=7913 RepID=UPI001B7E716B|nr:pre-mRNA-splicing factor CWC22 homolog isoform X2 [Polyodon spathula]
MEAESNEVGIEMRIHSTTEKEPSNSGNMDKPPSGRSGSSSEEEEHDKGKDKKEPSDPEKRPDDRSKKSPPQEKGGRASRSDDSDSSSDSSSGSDSGSSKESSASAGGARKMKSRVSQITHNFNEDARDQRKSPSPEYRDGERRRSRSPPDRDEDRGEDRYDRRYDRGRPGTGRYSDRDENPRERLREKYPDRDRERERERERTRYPSRERVRDRLPSSERDADLRRRGRSPSPVVEEPPVKKKKEELDPILTRTGGAYIPPAKLRMMQEQITDKSSMAYQRMSWEALKKSINGLINKVNVSNIANIIHELLQENIVRGRGQLARSILQAQNASPIFTHVYAAVVAIINSKFPQIGELVLKRLILNFRKGYRRNDKQLCLAASKFVAHLVNQNVAHEVLCLEMLTLLLERPNDDSVEVAISFLKECGLKLTEVSPRGINAIFERLRNILHESEIDKRVQYMIEVMFAIRKDGFKDHPVVPEGLDLVEEEDQFTHMLPLEDEYNPEDVLNVFKMDPNFLENEEKYKTIKKDILDEGSSDSGSGDDADGSDEDDDEEEVNEEEGEQEKVTIHDKTEVNLVAFRRTIYLAIQSSLDFEECAHKLIKMDFPDSQTKELCNMILDCCAQQRTYEKFFGLLAGRFCLLKKDYMESFEAIFKEQYETIHRLETNKLRNVARMFAHLLYTDSVPWSVLECILISEDTTTSSSRIFVKILFQELCAYMGLPKLNERLQDVTLQPYFEGLFPRDNPRNTRFAINFFTSIGLGGLTDELRDHLKNAPKMIMTQKQEVESSDSSSSSSDSDSSSDSESGSSDSDSSSSSNSDSSSSTSSSESSSRSDSDSEHRKKSSKKKDKGPKTSTSKKRSSEKVPTSKKQASRHSNNAEEQEMSSHKHSSKAHRQKDRPKDTSTHNRDDHRRSNKDPDRRRNHEFEDKRSDSQKDKENIKNNPYSEHDRDRYRSREEEKYSSRREERSKETNSRAGSEDGYKNGEGRRAEKFDKESRHSDRSRDTKRTDDRRRESSPRRRR